ncbi:MAG: PLP-dependent transferase [Solirubrobacterales bacterium]
MRLRPPPIESTARLHRATEAIVAGRGEAAAGAPLNCPPVFASAFRAGGERLYSRYGNPTWRAFEDAIGTLEGGTAVAFATGMAAAAAAIEALPPTARVLVGDTAYVEVRSLLAEREAAGRLRLAEVDPTDTRAVLGSLADVDMVWLDSITNPGLDVAEVDVIARAARALEGPQPRVTGEFRLGDVRHVFASAERARALLGFEATVEFQAGVAEFAGAPLRAPVTASPEAS